MKRLIVISLLLLGFSITPRAEGEKLIALTFDDGPHTKYTLEILDILKESGCVATFFIIGENAAEHPELLGKIKESGCEIGNHTWSHEYLDRLSEDKIRVEIEKTDKFIEECIGEKPKVFRPPGGRSNETVLKVAEEFGYMTVLWSKDTRDWSCPGVEYVVSSALDKNTSGDIILFHDYNSGKSPTPDALRKILPRLIEAGYKTVTVSELSSLMSK